MGCAQTAPRDATLDTWAEGFAHWHGVLGTGDASEARTLLAEMGEDPDGPLPRDNPDWNGWLMRTALGMSALSPAFLFR